MFLFRGVESHPRSLVKAVTWRALGSIDTFVLSYIYTGNTGAAGAIAGTEVFTKIFLFYFHERIWSLIRSCWTTGRVLSSGRRRGLKGVSPTYVLRQSRAIPSIERQMPQAAAPLNPRRESSSFDSVEPRTARRPGR